MVIVRRTVTLNDFLHKLLQELRGKIIAETGLNIGFTYILNVVVLLGFCNPLPNKELVKILESFNDENYESLELSDLGDRLLDFITLDRRLVED